MKILFMNYEFPPVGGGGAKSSEQFLKSLANYEGIDVELLTSTTRKSERGAEQFVDSVPRHNVYVPKSDLHYWTTLEIAQYLLKTVVSLRRLINRKKYDLYHSFFGFPTGLPPALLGCRPHVISLEGSDVPGFSPRVEKFRWLLEPIYRYIWRRSDRLVANSSDLRDLALDFDNEHPVEVIQNGIDCNRFSPSGNSRSSSGPLTLLTASRLVARKNIAAIIRALPNVIKRMTNRSIELLVAGDGPEQDYLRSIAEEQNVQDCVKWLGRVPLEQMPETYRKADIFVLVSEWEGNSNALLEALASGLPVVVTDTGGARDLVNGNGVILDHSDPETIAEAVVRIASDEEERQRMGRRSRDLAENLTWQTMADRYVKVYREAIEGRSGNVTD